MQLLNYSIGAFFSVMFAINPSFIIERSKDSNQIFYVVNEQQQMLDITEPINFYWIKHTENGKKEALTWIQEKYSYGLKYLKKTPNEAIFQFVSYNKQNFYLRKDTDGTFKVFTVFNKKNMIVNRIYIHIKGGTFWMPKIPQIDIEGIELKTSQKITEVFKP
ncbi:CDP-alcohol phosphatidyltransferase (plasmid) [Emticicia oligotrophica DSM 17448]|uniref:CDP-alcohol phosphatidyltransferase n=1 Tax=Emticicia oligotrophica (strain DSM 17448 / CIP 109782 / MTCC 6937 / GPTSA100-15) TaxID=929562 RepID=A0ABN4AS85_EMTOG|nr:DUF4833 domain-containing protein [Emticicia oligotrophica]AFK05498.1 CDP-alcohol phosphatidyltransferase [Emticicia oligotrophica DSM 17448]